MYKLLIVLSLIIIVSCSDKGTNPPPEENLCTFTDSTSHNFIWQVDTIGVFSSFLFDVAAINENNVWAVGKIETPEQDTIWGTNRKRHNAIKWNGDHYEYYQLLIEAYSGNPTIQELRTVIAFDESDIWLFSIAGSYIHWDGTNWESKYMGYATKSAPTKTWGPSPDNFFIVGYRGSITHYDGNTFHLMESGTDKDLFDITGFVDPKTGVTYAWAVGRDYILLYYDGQNWSTVWEEDNPYTDDDYNYPAALYSPAPGSLIIGLWKPYISRGYCFNAYDLSINKYLYDADVSLLDFAGIAANDLIMIGASGKIGHFNGSSVKVFEELSGGKFNYAVDFINSSVFVVGEILGQRGMFIRGKKF